MHSDIKTILGLLSKVILGKEHQIKLALACMLSKGHLLIEDVPGVGKTTLALALAKNFGLQFQRIQFTNDLLPSDILGVSIYEPNNAGFTFHPGPIFAQVVLADEINRASPKTQSALLESMEEQQVTIEGVSRNLPHPFFVIATKNSAKQVGTFPLPESQLDRFLMCLSLGYPDENSELELLSGKTRRDLLAETKAEFTPEKLMLLQEEVDNVHTSPALLAYLMALVKATRHHPAITLGVSPRGALALKKCAQAWALIHNRKEVIPEDIQSVFKAVCEHRLQSNTSNAEISEGILNSTKIP